MRQSVKKPQGQPQNSLERQLIELEQIVSLQGEQLHKQALEIIQLGMWQKGRQFAHIARLYPKSRRVIFLHPTLFSDNVKYAFLGFLPIAQKHGIDCHFLINDPQQQALLAKSGLPVLPPAEEWTLEHWRLLLGTKVIVACDHFSPNSWKPPMPYFLLQGAKLVQLWHGIPLKEIGLLYSDNPAGNSLRLSSTGPADLLVAPGTGLREKWREWFAFRSFAAAGYPRNDVLLREPKAHELVNVDLDALSEMKAAGAAGRKIIFYAPTFRDHNRAPWPTKTDFVRFADWCRQKGYFLLVKPHPVEQQGFDHIIKTMPGIHCARPNSDPYPLLRYANALVTDYSSIMFDFLLLDRPIVFYWPDHADYITQCRHLLPGFERSIAGEKTVNAEGLCQAIEQALSSGPDPWADKRRALARELFDHQDSDAAARVTRLILEQLDTPEELPAGWGL
jgi:CDP-glycerol glycerophosphotransferase